MNNIFSQNSEDLRDEESFAVFIINLIY